MVRCLVPKPLRLSDLVTAIKSDDRYGQWGQVGDHLPWSVTISADHRQPVTSKEESHSVTVETCVRETGHVRRPARDDVTCDRCEEVREAYQT